MVLEINVLCGENASSSPRNLLKKCPLFKTQAKWQWPGPGRQGLFVRSPREPAAVLPQCRERPAAAFPVFSLLGFIHSCDASRASKLPCYLQDVGVPSAKSTARSFQTVFRGQPIFTQCLRDARNYGFNGEVFSGVASCLRHLGGKAA